jgi:hypothetical protein
VTFGIEGLYVNLGNDGGDTDIVGINARTGNVIRVDGRNLDRDTENPSTSAPYEAPAWARQRRGGKGRRC